MFAENAALFYNTADFAVVGLWNGATPVNGIFDAAYAEPFGNDVVESAAPAWHCATSAMPGVKQGDTLVAAGLTYKVRNVQPDGTGHSLLRLELQ
jgi:hypothetical protein